MSKIPQIIWKDIPLCWGEFYQVSNTGLVRSKDRTINTLNPWGKLSERKYKGRIRHDTPLMNQVAFKEAERRGISKKVLKICLSEWDWEDSEGPEFGDGRGYL